MYLLERCNPWPHVANRHISVSQRCCDCEVILIMTAFVRFAPTALAAPVLITTSFATELATPGVTDEHRLRIRTPYHV